MLYVLKKISKGDDSFTTKTKSTGKENGSDFSLDKKAKEKKKNFSSKWKVKLPRSTRLNVIGFANLLFWMFTLHGWVTSSWTLLYITVYILKYISGLLSRTQVKLSKLGPKPNLLEKSTYKTCSFLGVDSCVISF